VVRDEQRLAERQQIAKELAEALAPLAAAADSALDDFVQVIRTPHLIAERSQRLQLEARTIIEGIVKAPILNPKVANPAQPVATRHGVHYKVLYELAVTDDPKVAPFLQGWLAGGEEARVYDGELPYKLAVFDKEVVLLTLARRIGHPAAMVVRNAPFARSMSILFDFFWNQAKPLTAAAPAEKAARPSNRKWNTFRAAAGTPGAQSQTMRRNTDVNDRHPENKRRK
jgi:HTH-type transcriptional regulator, sugar sensing transcriptional regulator